MTRPSECWACLGLFDNDESFRLLVFRRISEDGTDAARQLVDEHYADVHTAHERSWV